MAINFRELPIWILVLIFLALAVGLALAFEFVPYSPLQAKRTELEQKTQQVETLKGEVAQLEAFDRRKGDLKNEIEALNKQLEILRTIVPEEKEVDEFIRILQGEASSSGVAIRRLTAKPTNPRDYYIEMPFEIEADGPYYSVLDFFARLGRVPRVINVGDLALTGYQEAKGKKYPARAGTTVTGVFTATTFFTKGAEGPVAVAAKGKQPGKQPPAKR